MGSVTPTELATDELTLSGRIMPASNATFFGSIGSEEVVYKPVVGERPLWDFPDGTLAGREVCAYAVSEAVGWNIVPPTWLRDGPHGVGMVQLWREPDSSQNPITLAPSDQGEPGWPAGSWHRIIDGVDADDRLVSLLHEDSETLRKMAVFDVVTNNADRKGGHVLPMTDGHRFGVDHGLTFHSDHKLRTVLWGWIDQSLSDLELAGIERVKVALESGLGSTLAEHLTAQELEAFADRCESLLQRGTFPPPTGDMPAVPWPPF